MATVDFDGRDAIAYWLRRDLNEANARVAAMQGEREAANDLIAILQAELAAAKEAVFDAVNLAKSYGDEVTELRPWAEVGKRAVRENWYLATRNMLCCRRWYGDGHAPDCLLAQLKADIQEAMAPLVNEVMNEWEPQDE